jgi:23S rRNA-/tRNA-specific pseudouridylate synthase
MRPAASGGAGAPASVTDDEVLRRWSTPLGEVALVDARPLSGRRHQIGLDLRSVDSPLVVDPLYGGAERVLGSEQGVEAPELECARLTLHAPRLALVLLVWPVELRIEAPLAADLAALVDALDCVRRSAGRT